MMECLQRDDEGLIDAMLIAINANDRRYLSHQYNAISVAEAKNVGMIAMKVFADGAMYTKEPRWSRTPDDVVRIVGTEQLPSRPLIEYALTTPGIGTAIIGIGQIDSDVSACQLDQNVSAAQIQVNAMGESDRREVEELSLRARDGMTNWFQLPSQPLGPPRDVSLTVENRDGQRFVQVAWQTAYASDEPIMHYEILRDGESVAQVDHRPQVTKSPFVFEEAVEPGRYSYKVVTVDRGAKTAEAEPVEINTA
jgi:hypothetical protein